MRKWCSGLFSLILAGAQLNAAVIDNTWCRFKSPGFDLITDLPQNEARRLIEHLEQFRNSTESLISTSRKINTPIKAVIFKRRKDFSKVFNTKGFAGFMRPSLNSSTLILGPDRRGEYLLETAFHEYTHHLLRSQGQISYPMWYEEGFASYMASVEFVDGGWQIGSNVEYREPHTQAIVNQRNIRQVLVYESSHLRPRTDVSVREILSAKSLQDWEPEEIVSFYERSWLLVHMLRLGHQVGMVDRRAQTEEYLRLIDKGQPWQEAYDNTFDLSIDELGRVLNRYSRRLLLPTERVTTIAEATYPVKTSGCMSRSETALELGLASVHFNQDYASKLFDFAFEVDDQNSQALVGLSLANKYQGDFVAAVKEARRALQLDTDSVPARIQLANVLLDSCSHGHGKCDANLITATDLYQQVVQLEPNRIDAVFGLGVTYFFLDRPEDAIAYLQSAYAKAPWAPRINLFLGESYRLLGHAKKAKEHLSKAVRWESDKTWREKAQQALALL